jgi:hypothetical protein
MSDSQAALKRIMNDNEGPGQEIAIKIIEMERKLMENGHSVYFQWVAGHAGVEGNELADQHAKDAAAMTNRGDAITRHVRLWNTTTMANLSRRSSEEQSACTRKWIMKKVKSNRSYTLKRKLGIRPAFKSDPPPSKRLTSAYCQLASGHALTAIHLKRIGKRASDICWFCKKERMTRGHLFGFCTRFQKEWKELTSNAEAI